LAFPDYEGHIVARLIYYIYTSNYLSDDIATSKAISFHGISGLEDPHNTQYGCFNQISDVLTLHAKIYAIANKFSVASMKMESRRYFLLALSSWKITGMTPTPDLGESWLLLRDLIQLVYQTTPSADHGLRDFMIVFAHSVAARTHRDTIAQNSCWASNLVNRKLATTERKCSDCEASGRVFESLCEHYWRDCAVVECRERVEKQTWCLECGMMGGMRPTEGEVKSCFI
jgi:hypothetical protein